MYRLKKCSFNYFESDMLKVFEDTKGVIRIRKSKKDICDTDIS
jgi:hypothetical protein